MAYPTLTDTKTGSYTIDQFYGYNHNPKIQEGAFYETENLTTDNYPLLCTRKKRGYVAGTTTAINAKGMLGKKQLAWVDGQKLWYAGEDVSNHIGLLTSGEKQLVSMGAYICVFPDARYYNTEDPDDSGSMNNTRTAESVTASPCMIDGAGISVYTGSEAPGNGNPVSGAYWLDTSASPFQLKIYSGTTKTWTAVATPYVKLSGSNIGAGFKENDGVTISGLTGSAADINGSSIIQSVADNGDSIVVIGIVSQVETGMTCTVSRKVPKMDFICESQNRLWGCYYGLSEDGTETLNEIYCCALGDFKNWRRYAGISTDSYAASCGTDGPWTGAITHQGYPLFFKENHLHKVYISTSGAHQIIDTECRGVQSGCGKSLAIVDNVLFYKSRDGICAYDGSLPEPAGTSLGSTLYYNAVGGSIGSKYYVSMEDSAQKSSLFVYDKSSGLWMREDGTKAAFMARCGDDLYIMTGDGKLIAEHGTGGTHEGKLSWRADSGIIGCDIAEHKYVTRFNIRMKLPPGSRMEVFIEYDSDGMWIPCGTLEGYGMNSFVLPIRPVRCDHFRIRMQGKGDVMIYSFTKTYEVGTDVN